MKCVRMPILALLFLAACTQSSASSTYGPGVEVSAETMYGTSARISQPDELPVDRLVSERVLTAFLNERAIAPEAQAVRIHTVEGVVHLSGQVSTDAVKKRMVVVANAVGSVTRVVDELTVAPR